MPAPGDVHEVADRVDAGDVVAAGRQPGGDGADAARYVQDRRSRAGPADRRRALDVREDLVQQRLVRRKPGDDGIVGERVAPCEEALGGAHQRARAGGRRGLRLEHVARRELGLHQSRASLRAHTRRLAPLRKVRRVSSTRKPTARSFAAKRASSQ